MPFDELSANIVFNKNAILKIFFTTIFSVKIIDVRNLASKQRIWLLNHRIMYRNVVEAKTNTQVQKDEDDFHKSNAFKFRAVFSEN